MLRKILKKKSEISDVFVASNLPGDSSNMHDYFVTFKDGTIEKDKAYIGTILLNFSDELDKSSKRCFREKLRELHVSFFNENKQKE